MVNQADIRELNERRNDFQTALHTLQDINEWADSVNGDPTLHPEWESAQIALNEAVRYLFLHIDDVVSRAGELEDESGATLESLPSAAVTRSSDTAAFRRNRSRATRCSAC